MRVLFVFKSENFLAPIGLCMISAVAKKFGHEVRLSEMNTDDTLKTVKDYNPHIVAYSSSTGEAKHYLKMNDRIKEANPFIYTIMGGHHPTFFPEIINDSSLDAICQGEGEAAFADVLGGKSNIQNIRTKGSESLGLRKLVEDVDSLPFPDYSLMYDNTPLGKYPLKIFMASRGCPYGCTYCFNPSWNKLYNGQKIVRRHSVDYIIDQILWVKRKWPLTTVKFYDDIFCYQADAWLEEFAKKYRRQVGLPFFILTRADLLTEDMTNLLKYAGVKTISMSLESGNERIRNDLLKRHMSTESFIKAHELCRKYEITTFTNCIIALPTSRLKNDIESLDLCIKCKVDWVEFVIFYPFPRTVLGDMCERMGLYKPDYNYNREIIYN